ncbi:MAG: hypothetical protein EP344_13155 [Bacteroidetes bacterium]|nr:MAG: hypothetical protein EP344_13155 [Bacteroidota bacterium]
MKKIIILAVACSVCLSTLFAQSSLQPSGTLNAAMDKIQVMEGHWKGGGWLQMGPQRHEFTETETVTTHANGTVITIDGIGRNARDTAELVHQAFAVLSYDQQAGRYLMRAIRADGNHVDADFEVAADGSFVWGFSHPMAGRIRYTIRIADGRWSENGEMSRDGQTWMPFFQMNLVKVKM